MKYSVMNFYIKGRSTDGMSFVKIGAKTVLRFTV